MNAEQNVPIFLKFRAMTYPIAVRVPEAALPYLDRYAERTLSPDGKVIYRQPGDLAAPPEGVFRGGRPCCVWPC